MILSILYLRCCSARSCIRREYRIFQFSIWDAHLTEPRGQMRGTHQPFNSLFEMQTQTAFWWCAFSTTSFNSLFEMQKAKTALGQKAEEKKELSILYLRCTTYTLFVATDMSPNHLSILYLRCPFDLSADQLADLAVSFQFSIWDAAVSGQVYLFVEKTR